MREYRVEKAKGFANSLWKSHVIGATVYIIRGRSRFLEYFYGVLLRLYKCGGYKYTYFSNWESKNLLHANINITYLCLTMRNEIKYYKVNTIKKPSFFLIFLFILPKITLSKLPENTRLNFFFFAE